LAMLLDDNILFKRASPRRSLGKRRQVAALQI
jgi:hypothetical protein